MPTDQNQNPGMSGNSSFIPSDQNNPNNQNQATTQVENAGMDSQIDLNLDGISFAQDEASNPSISAEDSLSVDNLFGNTQTSESQMLGNPVDNMGNTPTNIQQNVNLQANTGNAGETDTQISGENSNTDKNAGEDDWLLQEDKEVQDSENVVESVVPETVDTIPVAPVQESPVETVTPTFPSQEPEGAGVDMTAIAGEFQSTGSESVENTMGETVSNNMPETVDTTLVAPVQESPVEAVTPTFPSQEPEGAGVDMAAIAGELQPVDNKETNTPSTENDVPVESLVIENVGVPTAQNPQGDIVSDTGTINQTQNAYVPNESDFQKMAELLDNSKPGQVDMSSVQQNNFENIQGQQEVMNGVSTQNLDNGQENRGMFNLDYVVSSLQEDKPQPSVQDNTTTQNIVENAVDVPSNLEATNTVEQNVQNGQVVENIAPVSAVVGGGSNMGTNVISSENTPVQPTGDPQVANPETVADDGQKKKQRTKGSILPVVIVLLILGLGVVVFICSKMFPDVVSSILGKNNVVIEYSNSDVELSGEIVVDDEQDTGELQEEDMEMENTGDNVDDLAGELLEDEGAEIDLGDDDVIDPGSLAAAILQGGELDDTDNQGEGESITEIHGTIDEGDIDTYKDLGDLIDENNMDKNTILEKLNDYKTQAEIYQERGNQNDNQATYKYGTYIIQKSTTLIENIETTGKMDINEINRYFDQFDSYLSKMEEIKSNS